MSGPTAFVQNLAVFPDTQCKRVAHAERQRIVSRPLAARFRSRTDVLSHQQGIQDRLLAPSQFGFRLRAIDRVGLGEGRQMQPRKNGLPVQSGFLGCFARPQARTIARMPARTGSGKRGQAASTSCKSGSIGAESLETAPDSAARSESAAAPRASETGVTFRSAKGLEQSGRGGMFDSSQALH